VEEYVSVVEEPYGMGFCARVTEQVGVVEEAGNY
jgi:hypothetical protein